MNNFYTFLLTRMTVILLDQTQAQESHTQVSADLVTDRQQAGRFLMIAGDLKPRKFTDKLYCNLYTMYMI